MDDHRTAEPLTETLSAGAAAAAAVLGTVFLAGGLVRSDERFLAFALSFAVGGVVAVAMPGLVRMPLWKRVRVVLAALGVGGAVALGARGIHSIVGATQDLWLRRDAPEGAPDVLLVTATAIGALPAATSKASWRRIGEVWAPSPRRDATLASILTGEEPIEHRVVFDGDPPRSGVRMLARLLRSAGYRTASFGCADLPSWANDGAGPVRESANARDALDWMYGTSGADTEQRRAPRFAHVHIGRWNERDSSAIAAAAERGAEVVVVSLPALGDSLDARLRSEVHWASQVDPPAEAPGPHGLVSILPTLLRRVGVALDSETADAPDLFDGSEDPFVVSIEHKRGGPHRIRAASVAGVLRVGATSLGEHPTDDWTLAGPTGEHFVYRNHVTSDGEAPTADLIEQLARWRERNGRFEWSPAR